MAIGACSVDDEKPQLNTAITRHIKVLQSSSSSQQARTVSIRALLDLSDYDNFPSLVIKSGGIPALVKQLQQPPSQVEMSLKHELRSLTALVISLLISGADTEEIRQHMLNAGAVAALISILKTKLQKLNSNELIDCKYRAALSICYLARNTTSIKNEIRLKGGIRPLVRFLTCQYEKLTEVALLTLYELVLDMEMNKQELINCKGLPIIIKMLDSENAKFQLNWVGILASLVVSSENIQKMVLAAGALRPVMSLLRSPYNEICIEAVSFVGHIISGQHYEKYPLEIHNAIEPLIQLLRSPNNELQKNSSYALCRIAQDPGVYPSICHYNGISPILELLETKVEDLQNCVASVLYGFAAKECTVVEMIKKGAVQKLEKIVLIDKKTQRYPGMIVQRMKNNMTKRTIERLTLCLSLPFGDIKDKINILFGVSIIGSSETVRKICASCQGHDMLVELLDLLNTRDQKLKMCACLALSQIAQNSASSANGGQISMESMVKTGEDCNNPRDFDVTFILNGKRYPANKQILMAKSEVFRAMFAGGFKETSCKEIRIKNISSDVFELFLSFLHTGSVEVDLELAPDLYELADQYGIVQLKELCIRKMSKDIEAHNLRILYDFAVFYSIVALKDSCVLFTLEKCEELQSEIGYRRLFEEILPAIRSFFERKVPNIVRRAYSRD